MKYQEKYNVKTAVEGTWKRTMRASHDTSADFGQFNILKAKYLEAGRGYIKPWTYINMEPLPQPTWGEVKFESRIFAVPITLIFPGYNDYKEDMLHVTATEETAALDVLPRALDANIVQAIQSYMTETEDDRDYDIAIYEQLVGTARIRYYNHTDKSAQIVKMLEQMGYKLQWTNVGYQQKNILRLLAVVKIYLDYYYNNAYKGDATYNELLGLLKRDNGNLVYDTTDLMKIFDACYEVFYDTDYFTGAWDHPNHPNIANQESTYKIMDINNSYNGPASVTQKQFISNRASEGEDPAITAERTSNATVANVGISQYALNMLKGLSSFLKRNQLAGGDMINRLIARYGKVPPRETMNKAILVGTTKWGMNVTPIFANADTASQGGERLGEYSGYAYAVSGKKGETMFELETNEACIIVETLTITPIETYVQGTDGENLATTRLDLPTPEFDTVGPETIMTEELIRGDSWDETINQTNLSNNIFGLTQRYSKWKIMRDTMSGNFTRKRFKEIFLPYTMMRYMPTNFRPEMFVHSKGFTQITSTEAKQYDRIFYAADLGKTVYDNFRVHHEIEIEWWGWLKPMYDVYEWEHEGGKEVLLKGNGPQAN